jgi:[acyl-carrier-protein] S-malonyltransferase
MMQVDPALGFVFPGQGSQSVGMLAGLAGAHRIVERTFAEASAELGRDLWSLCRSGPEEELNLTVNAQPVLLAAGVAVWRVRDSCGGMQPAMLAGHSLGEITALACAGSVDFPDAVRLVAERARCMQEAVPAGQGAMAAILGLDAGDIERICDEASQGEVVSAANYNSPGQIVIAGSSAAVQRALQLARERGAKRAVPLAVSVPSHCELMRPAAAAFGRHLDAVSFRDASIPVVCNVDAQARSDAAGLKAGLIEQMYRPVRWTDCMATMRAAGISRIVECGPGRILSGLIRRIDRNIELVDGSDPGALPSQPGG